MSTRNQRKHDVTRKQYYYGNAVNSLPKNLFDIIFKKRDIIPFGIIFTCEVYELDLTTFKLTAIITYIYFRY